MWFDAWIRHWRWRQTIKQARHERDAWKDLLSEWCMQTVGQTRISYVPIREGFWITWEATPRMGYPRLLGRWRNREAAVLSAMHRYHAKQRRREIEIQARVDAEGGPTPSTM
jgi:hypothetical protein